MCGLPQAGLISQQLLEKFLNIKGYQQSELTPGFWTHTWRPIYFSLCMDAFGVKYNGNQHTDYPISVLKEHYTISQYFKGQSYLGIDLNWDYQNSVFHISMLKYVANSIKLFHHKHPKNHRINLTPTSIPSMGQKHSTPLMRAATLSWHQQTKKLYKNSPALSFTTQEPLMRQ